MSHRIVPNLHNFYTHYLTKFFLTVAYIWIWQQSCSRLKGNQVDFHSRCFCFLASFQVILDSLNLSKDFTVHYASLHFVHGALPAFSFFLVSVIFKNFSSLCLPRAPVLVTLAFTVLFRFFLVKTKTRYI